MFPKSTRISASIIVVFVLLLASGCKSTQTTATVTKPSTAQGQQTTATLTAFPVATTAAPTLTPTPEPLALRVNGEAVTAAEYQAEQRQLQEALQTLGKSLTPEQQRQQVLDNLTETLLLAQGAVAGGFKVDDAAFKTEVDRLTQQLGSAQAIQDWMNQRGYNEATFNAALKRQMAAAWQRDQITAAVPLVAEQVHARQVLTTDEDVANRALAQLKVPGVNFASYAYQYDQQTSGDLGWFPRGYLTQPEVEAAAFQLQPGEISPVIKSAIGYHILQVISREPSRPLSPDVRRVLQHKALQDWLKARREGSKIEVLLP